MGGSTETTLTTIFAHADEAGPGGTVFIAEGPECGAYPTVRDEAILANASARLAEGAAQAAGRGTKRGREGGAGDEAEEAAPVKARRFQAGNGHAGGGSYLRSFLGDGGVCHGGEAMKSLSRRWVGYCGEACSMASHIVRRMGGDAESCRWTHTARTRAREEGRMAARATYAARKAKKKSLLVQLSAEQEAAHVVLVRKEHTLGTVLGLILRILRWEGEDEAFMHVNTAANGNFAPCTLAFAERRFVSGDRPMEHLRDILCTKTRTFKNGRACLERAFVRLILIATRVNEYVHTELLVQLARRPMLLLETDATEGLFALLAELWWWRMQLVDAVDMRYWRSARLGNALTADTSPPPDQYMPDLWPEVHAFVHSVVQVDEVTASAMLESDTTGWMAMCHRHIHGSGDVWGTVTARERAWYTFFAVNDVKQPSIRDVPQPIGAGAMRGSLWQLEHLDELPNFNRKKHSIEQDYLQGVLVQMGEDVAAFEDDTKEAWEVWLPKFIKSSITNKPLQTRALDIVNKYNHVKEALLEAGPPPMTTKENGQCDGCKGREGLVDQLSRRGRLVSRARQGRLGALPRPRRILLMGTTASKKPTGKTSGKAPAQSGTADRQIVRQWHYFPDHT